MDKIVLAEFGARRAMLIISCSYLDHFSYYPISQKVFINHVLAIGMTQHSLLVFFMIIYVPISLLTYSLSVTSVGSLLFLDEVLAQQAAESQVSEVQQGEPEGQQDSGSGEPSEQCPTNQHRVESTNECEWDNCGLATPPMYRNTQTGRCVSDCIEVGESWVKQGNVCILGEASNQTSTQNPPPASPVPGHGVGNENVTVQNEAENQLQINNATSSRLMTNLSSIPSTLTQSVESLAGDATLPYACFSNLFTCYCDGTDDCNKLTSSGECKSEVRTIEGKPGLGQCEWNTKP